MDLEISKKPYTKLFLCFAGVLIGVIILFAAWHAIKDYCIKYTENKKLSVSEIEALPVEMSNVIKITRYDGSFFSPDNINYVGDYARYSEDGDDFNQTHQLTVWITDDSGKLIDLYGNFVVKVINGRSYIEYKHLKHDIYEYQKGYYNPILYVSRDDINSILKN